MNKDEVYVGQWVIYRPHPSAAPEDGTVVSLDALERGIVLVKYATGLDAKSTYLVDLVPGRVAE